MSKYTTEVRYICETTAGLTDSVGFNSVDAVLDECVDKIFDFDYPIFDETYRRPLNKKILRNFYTREICAESVGLWKLYLQQRLNEIMPYYNKLYETDISKLNPYYNVDLTTTREKTGNKDGTTSDNNTINTSKQGHEYAYGQENKNKNGTDRDDYTNTLKRKNDGSDTITKQMTGTNKDKEVTTGKDHLKHLGSEAGEKTRTPQLTTVLTESGKNKDRYSDTPQGSLDNIENNTYLTNARLVDNTHTAVTNNSGKETEKYKGSDNYVNDGTNSQTVNKTGSKTETETTKGKNTLTADETGKKTGTKTINENTNTSDSRTTTQDIDTSTKELKNGKTNISTTEEYLEHVVGYKGNKSYAELLLEWRKSFLNIDRMILNDLEVCFFQLW